MRPCVQRSWPEWGGLAAAFDIAKSPAKTSASLSRMAPRVKQCLYGVKPYFTRGPSERLIVAGAKALYYGAEQGLEIVAMGEGFADREPHFLNCLGAAQTVVGSSLKDVMAHHPAVIEDLGDARGRVRGHARLNSGAERAIRH